MSSMILPSKAYDVLKPLATTVLPAVATLYAALASVWHYGYTVEVVATITAVNAFLGVILGLSTKAYNNSDAPYDGNLDVSEDDASQIHTLEITTSPEQLKDQDQVVFKVRKVGTSVAERELEA